MAQGSGTIQEGAGYFRASMADRAEHRLEMAHFGMALTF
jgi:hypothetical protein